MLHVNRCQIVGAAAAVIFIFGAVSSISVFTTQGEYGSLDREDFSSMADGIRISVKKADNFPAIGMTVKRNPFEEPSMWKSPKPEKLLPPPFVDLLRLVPSPVLLRRDGLPNLGSLPQVSEKNPDRNVITRLKRVFGTGKSRGVK